MDEKVKAKFIYEAIDDILKGKSDEDIISSMENTDLDLDKLLVKSSEVGFLPGVKKALKMGANIHAYNDYALQIASGNGHIDVVDLLLKNGADVQADDDLALQRASGNGHTDVIDLLLKNGADVHAHNNHALLYGLPLIIT